MDQEHHETLRKPVPQFAVIDFDRTMGKTNALMSRFYALAESFGINTKTILDAQNATEAHKRPSGEHKPFDPLPLLRKALGNDQNKINEFKEHFINAADPPVMYDDVAPFLEKLRLNNIEYGVLTYGVSKEWQEWKLAASGYRGRKIITTNEDKGDVVNGWFDDGIFKIEDEEHETIRAYSVCIIDDKKKAFASLPEGSTGFGLTGLMLLNQAE